MDSGFDKRGDRALAGSTLRNEAASYLEAIYDNARIEILVENKKVDIVATVVTHGKSTDLYVEVKDYGAHLERKHVVYIKNDYEPLLAKVAASELLIITRHGLSPSAQALVDGSPRVFHQTIWELEDTALGLMPYVRAQRDAFDEEGLCNYYVPAQARLACYDAEQHRSLSDDSENLFELVQSWIDEPHAPPLAVLGGYGAGKSSFAKRVLSAQAARALEDPAARRPVLVRLGAITRSSSLDSLLGSLFTSSYEVRGYSFRRFCDLNAKGRLLIILDGFDEMKHAMSWTEFRNEIAELNQLNQGDARILLLGRPSAFTSDDEHLEVLRGRRRTDTGTRRLLDWPEFREYELDAFTREERAEFVGRFLEWQGKASGVLLDPDVSRGRAAEVNQIADLDHDVFAKPVHARILVELALDPNFDLSTFAVGVTRWTLYSEFFQLLARREMQRPARRPIDAKHRLAFLRRTALWLWQERDGSTSFRAADLPAWIDEPLPGGETDAFEEKRREYLAGAFLERKANDIFYFPHRSFAEFLVAEELALNPPASHQHESYDRLARDGVAEFLASAPPSQNIAGWGATLGADSGKLTIDYILLLANDAGLDALVEKLPSHSPFKPALQILATRPADLGERQRILAETILRGSIDAIALLITSLVRFDDLIPKREGGPADAGSLTDLASVAAAGLISRIMSSVRETEPLARMTVNGDVEPLLRVAQSGLLIEQTEDSRVVYFSWSRLATAAAGIIERSGPSIELHSAGSNYRLMRDERLAYFEVRNLMGERTSEFFHQMVLRRGSLATISVVEHIERRGPTTGRHNL